MIKVKGPEIQLEGTFQDLLKEAARAVHAIAKAMENELSEEFEYDEAVEYLVEEIALLKKLDISDDDLLPQEIEKEFFKQLDELRAEEGDSENWIEYTSGVTTIDTSVKNPIQSSLKGFHMDPRTSNTLDIDDLRAIGKAKKKKKK